MLGGGRKVGDCIKKRGVHEAIVLTSLPGSNSIVDVAPA